MKTNLQKSMETKFQTDKFSGKKIRIIIIIFLENISSFDYFLPFLNNDSNYSPIITQNNDI